MFRRLVSLACFPVLWTIRIADHRAALSELARLDDHELADIGLCRPDLRDATALPLGRDPTAMLAMRAEERMAAQRAKRRTRPAPPRMAAE